MFAARQETAGHLRSKLREETKEVHNNRDRNFPLPTQMSKIFAKALTENRRRPNTEPRTCGASKEHELKSCICLSWNLVSSDVMSKPRETIRNYSEGVKMRVATNDLIVDSPTSTNSTAGKSETSKTIEVLEVLLAHSIHLRDLYRNARWQTAGIQFRRLRQLFDGHYKEQIHLVDVLIDRIHALNGAGRLFACDFLDRTQFSQIVAGRAATRHLLVELLDAHESVLSAALPTGTHYKQANSSWTRDFAVGQVVLTNDQQILAVSEQMTRRERMLQTHATWGDRD
jgi:starvation-inducible DNA-binding protein